MSAFALVLASCSGTKVEDPKTELKDHVCTEACQKSGKCVTVCGEKGHSCTSECEKEM